MQSFQVRVLHSPDALGSKQSGSDFPLRRLLSWRCWALSWAGLAGPRVCGVLRLEATHKDQCCTFVPPTRLAACS